GGADPGRDELDADGARARRAAVPPAGGGERPLAGAGLVVGPDGSDPPQRRALAGRYRGRRGRARRVAVCAPQLVGAGRPPGVHRPRGGGRDGAIPPVACVGVAAHPLAQAGDRGRRVIHGSSSRVSPWPTGRAAGSSSVTAFAFGSTVTRWGSS